jgi:ferredoxin
MTLRVSVDRRRCIGAGTWIYLAPTAFRWRDENLVKAEVLDPETVEEDVLRMAEAACPTEAVVFEEEGD